MPCCSTLLAWSSSTYDGTSSMMEQAYVNMPAYNYSLDFFFFTNFLHDLFEFWSIRVQLFALHHLLHHMTSSMAVWKCVPPKINRGLSVLQYSSVKFICTRSGPAWFWLIFLLFVFLLFVTTPSTLWRIMYFDFPALSCRFQCPSKRSTSTNNTPAATRPWEGARYPEGEPSASGGGHPCSTHRLLTFLNWEANPLMSALSLKVL